MCQILSEYFQSVFTVEDTSNIPVVVSKYTGDDPESKLCNFEITIKLVTKALKELKVNKAAGVDGLHSTFLINIKDEFVVPLSIMFNRSLNYTEIPIDWKTANVRAIFKKGNRKDPANYRPVSLTSHISKIFERIVKEQINQHLEKFKLIYESQHGFVKGKSCLTNLLEFNDYVSKLVDEGSAIDIIYLDFQKAFDKVPHQRLARKLEAYGIEGNVLNWIKLIVVEGQKAKDVYKWLQFGLGRGGQQSSTGISIRANLFTIFIDDIDDDIFSKILKFADDTKI